MHPQEKLFITIYDEYAFYGSINWNMASIFEDIASGLNSGNILIKRRIAQDKVWSIDSNGTIISYYKTDSRHQSFLVIHLSRDVVAIQSAISGCIEFKPRINRFQLEPCKYFDNYFNQIFLVTDENGIWHGNFENNFMNWGYCKKCVIGGFGALEQGILYDHYFEIFGKSIE